jgi:hypothetical protein
MLGRSLAYDQDEVVDHINFDGLDNRRENLRVCRRAENVAHQRLKFDSSSGIKGVSFDKSRGKWVAMIGYRGKQINIGRFDTKEHAFIAYNAVAKVIFGRFFWDQANEAPTVEMLGWATGDH